MSAVKAQTKSGNMMIGGGFSIASQTRQNSDTKYSRFNFTPSFGYFVVDNFAIGAMLSLGSETNDNGTSKTVATSFSLGPVARYYMFTSNDKFAFYGQALILFGSSSYNNTPAPDSKSSSIYFNVSPGFAYFFNEHWALELQLEGLAISSSDPDKDNNDDKSTYVSFGVNSFNPTLGFRYHF